MPPIADILPPLHAADTAEELWNAFSTLLQKSLSPLNDILFASPTLGFHPVFARTLSAYPRGEGYWARLVEIAGVTDVMTHFPGLPAARMSDHFDRSRERDELLYREFMEPEGWAYCANIFFWGPDACPLGTLAMNRTAAQGDFTDEEMKYIHELQPHLQAALNRVIRLCNREVALTALSQSLEVLPVPIVTLNDKLQFTFLNHAGREALHQWATGRAEARVWKNQNHLPEDLATACQALRQIWEHRIQADTYQGEDIVIECTHPDENEFLATLRIVQPPNKSTELGFLLTFQNPASPHHATAQALNLLGTLTRGEREVARMASQGHLNEDIAKELGISIHTVRAHLRKVFSKLEIDSRSRLAPLFRSLE